MMRKTNAKVSIQRSSAAEYLTFIAASQQNGVEALFADKTIWLSQKMMGLLYDIEAHTVNYHLKKKFSDNELDENSVARNFRVTANDGKNYNTKHYNLTSQNIPRTQDNRWLSEKKTPRIEYNRDLSVMCSFTIFGGSYGA